MACTFWDFLFRKQKGSIYKVEWNAKALKLNISKLLRLQIEPYNSKGTKWHCGFEILVQKPGYSV